MTWEVTQTKPSLPVVFGPQKRVNVGRMEYFSCNSVGFSPKTITLKWFKNGNEIHPLRTKILPEDDSVSYNITSAVRVKLEASDVHSEVICEVNHSTLLFPLRGTKNLSDIIRVRPSVNISPHLLAMNDRNITCHVTKFYPKTVSVIWLENGTEIGKGKTVGPTENKDGTFSLNTSLEVNVSGQNEDQRKITCQVLHDFQALINVSQVFKAPSLNRTVDQKKSGQGVSGQLFVIFLLGLKVLLLFIIFLLYSLRKQKLKGKRGFQRLSSLSHIPHLQPLSFNFLLPSSRVLTYDWKPQRQGILHPTPSPEKYPTVSRCRLLFGKDS
ncbi:signal-regulatory protein beta-1-like [Petaurus breviceps papuanus]|uniref:signal-regulatory protein beta-1-like n=1 Tax=Petaurus breviceps papuanus TaxID=3040969 RepID=UPI0036D8BBE5